ncbi:hypothetical protein DOE76_00350 [Leifsonia sp. ku-ls]|nr:hypothetical protein DOE76_00350 [Leifsonia sp. ku-ls]
MSDADGGDRHTPARDAAPGRSRRTLALARLAWVGVLALTAAFHVVRGAPVDATIYAAASALLLLDQLGWLRVPLRLNADRDTWSRRLVAAVLIVVAALALGFSPLYGPADAAVVVGIGVLLLPVAWAERERAAGARPPGAAERRALRRSAVLWSAIIAAGCLWEVGAFFLGRSLPGGEQDFPALSDLVDPVLASPPARAVLVAVWLLGGYALLRRGRPR